MPEWHLENEGVEISHKEILRFHLSWFRPTKSFLSAIDLYVDSVWAIEPFLLRSITYIRTHIQTLMYSIQTFFVSVNTEELIRLLLLMARLLSVELRS